MEYDYIYEPYLQVGPMTCSRWPRENELNGISIDLFSHISLLGQLFVLLAFCFMSLFLILCFYGFWSCMLVSCVCSFLLVCCFTFCLFSKDTERKRTGSRVGREDLRWVSGEKAMIRIFCVKKIYNFWLTIAIKLVLFGFSFINELFHWNFLRL